MATPANPLAGRRFVDEAGNPIVPGCKLGEGGEGVVHLVDGDPRSVLKIWHPGKTPQDADAKIRHLVSNPVAPDLGATWHITWPQHLVTENGLIVGYTMPILNPAESWEPIVEYYNRRAAQGTGAAQAREIQIDDRVRMARNLALGFRAVHDAGYVIGDVNEKNVEVNRQNDIAMVDCDSYGFTDSATGRTFSNNMGRPEFQAPEAQGDYENRTQNHDCFGLAVVIFNLLTGYHPYTVTNQPSHALPGERISAWLFPPAGRGVTAPAPYNEAWNALTDKQKALFLRCFDKRNEGTSRPTPEEWVEALSEMPDVPTSAPPPTPSPPPGPTPSPTLPRPAPAPRRYYSPPSTSSGDWIYWVLAAAGYGALLSLTFFSEFRPWWWLSLTLVSGALLYLPARRLFQRPISMPRRILIGVASIVTAIVSLGLIGAAIDTWPWWLWLSTGLGTAFIFLVPARELLLRLLHSPHAWRRWTAIGAVSLLGVFILGNLTAASIRDWSDWRQSLNTASAGVAVGTPAVSLAAAAVEHTAALPPPTDAPTPLPAPTDTSVPAVALLPPSETPTATPTVEPSPTATPSPPSPIPIPPVTVPPPPTVTPTPEPTPTREPILVKPDLALAERTFAWHPERPSLGDPVTFSILVRNDGGYAAPSSLGYRIYSVSNHLEPVSEGSIDVPDIPAGDQVEVRFEWTAQAGHHSLEVEVDVTDQLEETAESNNSAANLLYDGTALADLVVESITWSPEIPAMGDPVTFSVTLNNQGDGRASPFRVQLYLGNDLLGEAALQEVPSGESETLTFDWTAQAGTSTLTVVADTGVEVTETDEGNNELIKLYDATTFVDLTVEEIYWEPPNPSVGDDVSISVVVRNRGTLDSTESTVEISGLPTEGTEFTSEVQLAVIPAGDSTATTIQWRVQPGDFTLTAHADVQQTVIESDEGNNELSVPYDATALADLVVTDINWKPVSPAFGEDVDIAVHLENRGDGTSLPTDVRLYLNDTPYGEAVALPGLSSMASHVASFTWTADIGRHELRAHVDDSELVFEIEETNNGSETFAYDHTRVADLRVRSVDWRPESPSVGDTVTFRITVENRGDAPAGDFHVSFRDTSSVWPPIEKVVSDNVASGQSTTVNFEWPADADPHEFAAVADSRAEVTESNEDNNELAVHYAATVAADLVLSRVSASPRSPSIDEDTIIKVSTKNEGHGRAGPFIVTLNITGPDGVLGEINRKIDELAVGATKVLEFPWTAKAGRHTFTATADSRRVIAETDESNNVLEETLETALSDLKVTEVQFDNQNQSAGDSIEVSVRIENGGGGDSGRFIVALYVDGNNKPYDTTRLNSLEPNTSAYIVFTWQAVEGCHSLFVIVDERGDIPEEDEGNNRSETFEICASGSQ